MFTQPDSLLQNILDPQSLNRYSFERSNPYKYKDPTGHIFLAEGGIIYLVFIGLGILGTILLNYQDKDKEPTPEPEPIHQDNTITATPKITDEAMISSNEQIEETKPPSPKVEEEKQEDKAICEGCNVKMQVDNQGRLVEVTFNSLGQEVDRKLSGSKGIWAKYWEIKQEAEEDEEPDPPPPPEKKN